MSSTSTAAVEPGTRLFPAVELVNRYESNPGDDVAEDLAFPGEVGNDHLLPHIGTYHALLEEIGFDGPITFEDFSRATAEAALADTLGHLALAVDRW